MVMEMLSAGYKSTLRNSLEAFPKEMAQDSVQL